MRSGEINLSDEDVAALRKLVDEADVAGTRYPEAILQEMEGNCISLSEWKY